MSRYLSRGSSADPLRLSHQALDSCGAKIKLTITHKNERLPVTLLYRNHQQPAQLKSVQMWDSHFQALCKHSPFQLLYVWCIFSLDREAKECYALNLLNFHTGAHTSTRSRDQKRGRKKNEVACGSQPKITKLCAGMSRYWWLVAQATLMTSC